LSRTSPFFANGTEFEAKQSTMATDNVTDKALARKMALLQLGNSEEGTWVSTPRCGRCVWGHC
jgi:hypothetical protein